MKVVFIALLSLIFLENFSIALSENEDNEIGDDKKVVCYFGSWSYYRLGKAKFTVDDIEPQLCTHIMYTFFGVHDNGTYKSLDPYLDYSENDGQGYVSKFIKLKEKNPSVKLMISIGGWSMGGEMFSNIVSNSTLRKNFILSVLDLLQKFNFDGFDFDWEYPKEDEKEKFIKLLKNLKNKLHAAGKLLTIAVGATSSRAQESYDIPKIAAEVDFINLMTYDLHGIWDRKTGIHSPLYANDQLSVDDCVKYWLAQGCPKHKLIIGIPLYGRSFSLSSTKSYRIGQPISAAGKAGNFLKSADTAGNLPYNEICFNINNKKWIRVFAKTEKTPYAYKKDQWVSYDDLQSIDLKLDYILSKNLGGAMFWSIETDDFGNICGDGKFPLLSLAHRRLILNDESSENFESTENNSSDDEEESTSDECEESSEEEEEEENDRNFNVPFFIQIIQKYKQRAIKS
ncbi:hypothetical protein PVAND_003115 [Polypedilum vanderplanki]|uniref:GH18 domain-containing protein n=1 Tax=Polypedilum vanderplanki TaxID=319348 RepID=A0A9J6BTZ2_POLVA|nr:hypothetical protein PVAND_003115 [Polypedilum vanderplanki]